MYSYIKYLIVSTVDAGFVAKQKKVLSLFERVDETDKSTDCYKAGFNYNIETNIDKYTVSIKPSIKHGSYFYVRNTS